MEVRNTNLYIMGLKSLVDYVDRVEGIIRRFEGGVVGDWGVGEGNGEAEGGGGGWEGGL